MNHLVDQNSFLSRLPQPLYLRISIYSSENPPSKIELNTSGNRILKGSLVTEVVNGKCEFDKLQIKEVSSHFRNGWIFFVVQPISQLSKATGKYGSDMQDRQEDNGCREIVRDMNECLNMIDMGGNCPYNFEKNVNCMDDEIKAANNPIANMLNDTILVEDIKPFVMDNIIVKAKLKLKKIPKGEKKNSSKLLSSKLSGIQNYGI